MDITNKDIYLYILNKSLLNQDLIKEIESKIVSDKEFLQKVEEIREFNDIYNKFSEVDNIYHLYPLQENEEKSLPKLAAQQTEEINREIKFINTFVSAEKLIMTRMLFDPSKSEYSLYIISEDPYIITKNAIVNISGFEKEFIADENGVVRIKSDYISPSSKISVRLKT